MPLRRQELHHQSQPAYHWQDWQRPRGWLSIMPGDQCIVATWIVLSHLNYVRQNLNFFWMWTVFSYMRFFGVFLIPFFNLTPLQKCLHLKAMQGFRGTLKPAIQNRKVSGGLRGKTETLRYRYCPSTSTPQIQKRLNMLVPFGLIRLSGAPTDSKHQETLSQADHK